MWKHVLIASSFDYALGIIPSIDDAATEVATLPATLALASAANPSAISSSVGDAAVLPGVGISGTLNVTATNPTEFLANQVDRAQELQNWLAGSLNLPPASVAVTIPTQATTTLAPVNATGNTTIAPVVTTVAPLVTAPVPVVTVPVTTVAPPVTTVAPPVTTVAPPVTTVAPPVTTTAAPVVTTPVAARRLQPGTVPVTTVAPVVTDVVPGVTTVAPVVTTAAPAENATLVGDDVPVAPDPDPNLIVTTYVVTLPPGKAEISTRLTATPAADLLASFSNQLGNGTVTSASVTMAPATTTGLSGSLLLGVADTSASGIESTASQLGLRRSIADLAGVWYGDVGAITFTSADGAPLEPEAPEVSDTPNSAAGLNTEVVSGRRLTAGSVNAAFSIAVPGAAAQGYAKDCSMKNVVAQPLANVADPPVDNSFTQLTDVNGVAAPVTQASCATEAASRAAELWSFSTAGAPAVSTCSISSWAGLSSATVSRGAVTQVGAGGCGDCPSQLVAGSAFPGADVAASNAAFGGHQPFNLQCWPKNAALDLMDCGHQVVQTTANGWPGTCNNLNANADATTQQACELACQNDPFCTVWMWATPASSPTDASTAVCYMGVGNECWTEMPGGSGIGSVTVAQRLQHGLVNVIQDNLVTHVLSGLQMQFAENVQLNGVPLTAEQQKENCRIICHSAIQCTFWQSYYDQGQGTDKGCWIEAPGMDAAGPGVIAGQFVEYPTTVSAFRDGDGDTSFITGGQYIQHYCDVPTLPSRPPATTTTTTTVVVQAGAVVTPAPESGGFMNPYGYLLIVGLLICAVCGIGALMMGNQKPEKKKGTRAVKPIKAKAPEPPPAPPQPVVPLMAPQMIVQPTIPQPLAMTTIQQPMVAAQAVAQPIFQSYAGAPSMVQRPY
jgi:hypothetical protein